MRSEVIRRKVLNLAISFKLFQIPLVCQQFCENTTNMDELAEFALFEMTYPSFNAMTRLIFFKSQIGNHINIIA